MSFSWCVRRARGLEAVDATRRGHPELQTRQQAALEELADLRRERDVPVVREP